MRSLLFVVLFVVGGVFGQFSFGCVLPPYPENGTWTLLSTDIKYRPGETVDLETIIQISCRKDFEVEGTGFSICEDNKWTEDLVCEKPKPPPPKSSKMCRKLESTSLMDIKCKQDGKLVDCGKAEDGTIATLSCVPFYTLSSPSRHLRCIDGSWDYPTPTCTPECGIKRSQSNINKKQVGQGWHVLIFKKYKEEFTFICMGTLISNNIVVIAAHCIIEEYEKRNVTNLDDYLVAAGKYTRQFNDTRDLTTQYRKLKLITASPIFRGLTTNYIGDFALMVTEEPFQLNQFVRPVCRGRFDLKNRVGTIIGFEEQADHLIANELSEMEQPAVETLKCEQELPRDFLPYLTHDKFCAGYFKQGKGFCRGFGGSGLVTEVENNFYLMGIASARPVKDGTCDYDQYSVFTNVQAYEEFLDRVIRKYSLQVQTKDFLQHSDAL